MIDEKYWREKLEKLKTELHALDQNAAESRQAVTLDQTSVGRLSRMDAIQGQAMHNAIAERRHKTLQRIDHALKNLADGEFGYCLNCGDDIALKRLELDPTTALCTHCAK